MAGNYIRLQWLLRVVGGIDLAALLAVTAPRSWLAWGASLTDTGPLPTGPLSDYLMRNGCAMYALHGLGLLAVSTDVERYRPLIQFMAVASMIHGGIVFLIGCAAGMPTWWRCIEGPTLIFLAATAFRLSMLPESKSEAARCSGD